MPDDQSPAAGPVLRTVRFRVAMGDTDAAQQIYFGAAAGWAERMLTGFLADEGVPTSGLLADNLGLPAVEVTIRYRAPLRLDDPVRGELAVLRRSRRSVTWRCEFFRDEESQVAVQADLTQVSVVLTAGGPVAVALPQRLADILSRPASREPA